MRRELAKLEAEKELAEESAQHATLLRQQQAQLEEWEHKLEQQKLSQQEEQKGIR